jgi:hypothetical protein
MGAAVPTDDLPSSGIVPALDLPSAPAKTVAAPATPAAAENQAVAQKPSTDALTSDDRLRILHDEFQKAQAAFSAALASGDKAAIDREKANVEGAARQINREKPGEAPSIDYAVPGRMAVSAGNTVGTNMPEDKMAQRAAYGTLGAAGTTAATGAKIALYRAAVGVKKALQNRNAGAPADTPVTPPAGAPVTSPAGAPVTSPAGAPVAAPVTGAPVATGPQVEPTAEQAARILQGGESDTKGTTGRARQTGYNIQTAQEAAIKTLMENGMSELDARAQLAKMPGLTATSSGVIVPRSTAVPTAGPRPQGPAVWQRPRAIGPAPWANTNTPDVGAVVPSVGNVVPPAAGMGDIGNVRPGNAPLPTAPVAPAASVTPAGPSALDTIKGYASKTGNTVANVLQHPLSVSASMGFGMGAMAPEIMEHANKNDWAGVAKDLGLGAAYGTVPALLPTAIQKGLAKTSPVAAFGANELDALDRLKKKDYTGTTISGIGGLAALAPLIVSGPAGWTIGGLGAVSPAIVNYLRDKAHAERMGGGRGAVNPTENFIPVAPVPGRDSSRMAP